MPHHHLPDVITTIRCLAHTPHEAECLVRFLVLGLMLLAVMLGLLNRQSHEPEDSTTGFGEFTEKSRPLFFLCPIPAHAVRSTVPFSLY
jgi:hypothetical protein